MDTLLTITLADKSHTSVITSSPFSTKVLPLSTISTIQSARLITAPNSTEPLSLMISHFLFLDSTHVSPGELLNFIEVFPFLNENAIVVIHDLLWHYYKKVQIKFFPSNINLMSALNGDKIFFIIKKMEL